MNPSGPPTSTAEGLSNITEAHNCILLHGEQGLPPIQVHIACAVSILWAQLSPQPLEYSSYQTFHKLTLKAHPESITKIRVRDYLDIKYSSLFHVFSKLI